MSKSKRLNRDHAKRTQRPMVEDRIIAEHLTALLTPTITSINKFLPMVMPCEIVWLRLALEQKRPPLLLFV